MASYFFVGLGGSGMLPLAEIVKAGGATVAGSDRAYDQGRTPEKFEALKAAGFSLHPQDGSGIRAGQIVVGSAAIEETVPDIARAKDLGLERLTRAQLLARLLNAAPVSVAVGGTSGKSTVTGMTGWILAEAGLDPTIVNGAPMRNFGSASRTGEGGGVFVSEVDESDGSISLYRPTVGIVTNIALDHKPLHELRGLFSGFVSACQRPVVNADDIESAALAGLRFGFGDKADVRGSAVEESPGGIAFQVAHRGAAAWVTLPVPGRHNAANALAAIAAAISLDVPLTQAAAALATYRGIARRLEIVGEANGVTVIDDFGHNPDKIAATLTTLGAFPGRLLVFFQPHGYGPLKLMARELGESFANNMRPGDHLIVSDPAYFGGTTDKSVGSDALTAHVPNAEHISLRDLCSTKLLELARPGDRIVVMGARDDSLTTFAQGLLAGLAARNP
jgi:UDP-N-acetylmuramate--alanine ligase